MSAISYHFGSKEGLYRECFQEEGQDLLTIVKMTLTPPENKVDFKTRLSTFLNQYFDHSFKNRETILLLGKDVGSKSAMESIEKLFNEIPDGIIRFLISAQDKKIIRADLNLDYLCSFLLDPIFMQVLFADHTKLKKAFSDPQVRKDFVDQHLSVFFNSIF